MTLNLGSQKAGADKCLLIQPVSACSTKREETPEGPTVQGPKRGV